MHKISNYLMLNWNFLAVNDVIWSNCKGNNFKDKNIELKQLKQLE